MNRPGRLGGMTIGCTLAHTTQLRFQTRRLQKRVPPAIPPQPRPHNAGGDRPGGHRAFVVSLPSPQGQPDSLLLTWTPALGRGSYLLPLAPEAKLPLVIRLAVADGDEATLQIFRADADPCEEEASLWGENRAKCHGKAVPRGHSAIGEGETPPRQRVCRALSGSLGAQPPLPAAVRGSDRDPPPCSSPPATLGPSPRSSPPTGPWPGRGHGCALSQLPVASLHPTP